MSVVVSCHDPTPQVLEGARFCLAKELALKPDVHAFVREKLLARASVTVRPTSRGRKEIDDWSIYAPFRYVPVRA